MAAKDIMIGFANEHGWTESTQLELMFQFVDELGDHGAKTFHGFLQERADTDGEYMSLEQCRTSGLHLASCDDDGYCNSCGEQ